MDVCDLSHILDTDRVPFTGHNGGRPLISPGRVEGQGALDDPTRNSLPASGKAFLGRVVNLELVIG